MSKDSLNMEDKLFAIVEKYQRKARAQELWLKRSRERSEKEIERLRKVFDNELAEWRDATSKQRKEWVEDELLRREKDKTKIEKIKTEEFIKGYRE